MPACFLDVERKCSDSLFDVFRLRSKVCGSPVTRRGTNALYRYLDNDEIPGSPEGRGKFWPCCNPPSYTSSTWECGALPMCFPAKDGCCIALSSSFAPQGSRGTHQFEHSRSRILPHICPLNHRPADDGESLVFERGKQAAHATQPPSVPEMVHSYYITSYVSWTK